jgi:transposase InsO family protein
VRYNGKLEIFNTDQGSQFTGSAFTGVLANNDIAISMDGKGAWRDNIFVERLWHSVRYEEVYLRAYDSVGEARCLPRCIRRARDKNAMAIAFPDTVWWHDDLKSRPTADEPIGMKEQAIVLSCRRIETL